MRFFLRKPIRAIRGDIDSSTPVNHSEKQPTALSSAVKENTERIRRMLADASDLVVRTFTIGHSEQSCALLYIDGLADKLLLHEQVMHRLQHTDIELPAEPADRFGAIVDGYLSVGEIETADTVDKLLLTILSGDAALLLDGVDKGILIGSKGWDRRSIEEPSTEALVRGPREGFTEDIRTNTALIRRRFRDPTLRFVDYRVGRRSKKTLLVTYMEGIAPPELVEEVKRRVESIDLDEAPESGFIEQWIEDSFLSPFPQILHTERPDKVTTALAQGKIAILLDGTPFALIMPITFPSLIQSPEDYYERWQIGSLIRILRYIAAFLSVFFPALYIALVSYHQGMIPSKLAFSIAAAREGVPFPAVVEALMMEATLELLREAGIRLPKPIGQTIGIVGGLVIGEAAVQAGIVSPIMVIVVAITAISSFAIPSYSAGIAFRMIRFLTMFAAGLLGFYGIVLTYIAINIHLVRLTSFGIPYSTPFAPFFRHDLQDLVIRAPLVMQQKRPEYLKTADKKRLGKEKPK